jgi:di/tricarboxylate transporter
MTRDQIAILVILSITVILFLSGKWRHDMVAMAALLACVLVKVVPGELAFSGFGHPAVVTVACVLILSRSLQTSGAIDAVTRRLIPTASGPTFTIAALAALGALLSAFMNNVGALALLMPVAIQVAAKQGLPPGRVLMPLAFGLLPAAISFAAGVLAGMALKVISLRTVYEAVDWPVIVLLGALIPVAGRWRPPVPRT